MDVGKNIGDPLSVILESSQEAQFTSRGGVNPPPLEEPQAPEAVPAPNDNSARVTSMEVICSLVRSRIFRSALFAGAAVGLTHYLALTSVTAAMGAAGTALGALVGTVALAALAANPITFPALLVVGVAALALSILGKKRAVRVLSAIVTVVAAAAFVTIAATPPAWVVLTAVGIAAVGVAIVCQLPGKGAQKMSLEISSLKRVWLSLRRKSYNEITIERRNGLTARLYLGPIPNRLTRDLRYLNNTEERNADGVVTRQKVTAVLSCNQRLERINRLAHFPYNQETAAADGIESRREIEATDHHPLSIENLENAAEFIHDELDIKQQSVYVHCLAGVGRSAMAVAAYLIKYQGMTVDEAIATIRASRPSSTINKPSKRGNLDAFATICELQKLKIDHLIPEGMSDQETGKLMAAVREMRDATGTNYPDAAEASLIKVLGYQPQQTKEAELLWNRKGELLRRYKMELNRTQKGS